MFSCARRNFAAATIFMARVIFRVFVTEPMRVRRDFNEGIGRSHCRAASGAEVVQDGAQAWNRLLNSSRAATNF